MIIIEIDTDFKNQVRHHLALSFSTNNIECRIPKSHLNVKFLLISNCLKRTKIKHKNCVH